MSCGCDLTQPNAVCEQIVKSPNARACMHALGTETRAACPAIGLADMTLMLWVPYLRVSYIQRRVSRPL